MRTPRVLALAGTILVVLGACTSGGGATAAPTTAAPTATAAATTVDGPTEGTLVSNTTRSGHFLSEWMRTAGKSEPDVKLPGSGTCGSTASQTKSSASNPPPTNKKYRSKGISNTTLPARTWIIRLTSDIAIGSVRRLTVQ